MTLERWTLFFGRSAMHARIWSLLDAMHACMTLSVIRSCGSFTLSPPPNDQASECRPSSSLASFLRSQTISYYRRAEPINNSFLALLQILSQSISCMAWYFHLFINCFIHGVCLLLLLSEQLLARAYYRSFYWN